MLWDIVDLFAYDKLTSELAEVVYEILQVFLTYFDLIYLDFTFRLNCKF